jgi:LEA14-like dessication related protein
VTGVRRAGLLLLAALPACTPIGLWMYQEPEVTVARVRLQTDTTGTAPMIVALDLNNPNDYPLSVTQVALELALDELSVGELARDAAVPVPKLTTTTMAFPLVRTSGATPERLQTLATGTHRFSVAGRATFTTPFGKRTVRFAQEGEMAFEPPASPASAPVDPGASP